MMFSGTLSARNGCIIATNTSDENADIEIAVGNNEYTKGYAHVVLSNLAPGEQRDVCLTTVALAVQGEQVSIDENAELEFDNITVLVTGVEAVGTPIGTFTVRKAAFKEEEKK